MYPVALPGIMSVKGGKSEVSMEVICDIDLSIWSFKFGLPGVLNNVNILKFSNHSSKVISGRFPPVTSQYTIDSKEFSRLYYLTVGFYPPWIIFIKVSIL